VTYGSTNIGLTSSHNIVTKLHGANTLITVVPQMGITLGITGGVPYRIDIMGLAESASTVVDAHISAYANLG
jgi:hypothetical protein